MTGYNKAKLIARGAKKAVEEGVETWRGRNKEPAEEPAGRTSETRCHSFVPGTGVLLADGSTKPIEDIKTGDKVKVTDPDTGKTTTRKVAGTIVTEDDKNFVDLTVANSAGEPSAGLIATTTHPFWVQSQHAWVKADDLRPGMTLRTPDGRTVTVKHARHFTQRLRTHDLTVSGIHTYYVLAGTTPVLVHNCGNAATHDAGNVVDDNVYFHYTSEGGHSGILADDGSLRIGANSAGKVHVTQEIGSPSEIEQNIFIGSPMYAGKADYMFAFRMPGGVELGPGSQPNELITRGSLKIPAVNVLFHRRNPF
ncbi:polymorphic toxin-type HINT domain-containing protein [Streptomyces sp. AgN23]|uniref:polymorphic toxin-type HINT domain-containing protein n=1 Tax=Streptomyces sp. AgN23 TaxID=1188315 RepID=UPI001B33140F|nr:polymorphic toxin-type HINT domain-containing protein [Streptomyces sp. AgN23]QTI88212.1 hypothetical protein AS97_46220 [Streptomyces sp. AgN23]WTB09297.1 HINT domain-containing protein [Streptomyces antimycoticus]